ncbi:MFS transporter [Facilibium subflavum]|uniref:MFS transporter n=1 Tax=Facilibium subflavum TaxID=2219058 RepID=UPI0013C32F9B|nr:MFS transporter [Facilibium subflavum]
MPNKITLLFLSCLCGFSVANIYYMQPLFVLMADSYHMNVDTVTTLSAITQIGYALGLLLIVPISDAFCRKKLIIRLFILNAIAQALIAVQPNFFLLFPLSLIIGASSVSAQVVIPAITLISSKEDQGKNVATLMSGLFSGIVFARLLSGFVGHYFGWYGIYYVCVVIDLVFIGLLLTCFPKIPMGQKTNYSTLLGSLWGLLIRQPVLQKSCVLGGVIFFAFSGLWGALALLLSQAPYFYNSSIIGSFALIGLFGVFASGFIGKAADRHGPMVIVRWVPVPVLLSFLILSQASMSVWVIIIAMAILDIASRASLLSNQLVNYTLSAQNRARLNTLFMFFYFIGGAFGTSVGANVAERYHWHGIAVFGMVCALFALMVNILWRKPSELLAH